MNQLYVKHKNFQEALYTMANTDFDTKQKDCVEYLEVIRDILWNKMTEVRS